jgi:molybdate transport system substrate-binding protein
MSTPLTIISSMATRQVLTALVAQYTQASGQAVTLESVGGVDAAKRVQAGEPFDVVMLASNAIDQLTAAGQLVAGSRVDLVRSGVSVAVREGTAPPDISSEAALKQTVLDAKSLSYSTGPSGVALQKMFERWDIAEQLEGRVVQAPPGVPVGSLVADGKVELGFQQLSELLHLPGITIVGPLPPAIQIITTFSAGISATCKRPDAARAMLAYMVSPAGDDAKRQQGMDPARAG